MALMQADNSGSVIVDNKHKKGIGNSSCDPIGTKKARKEKQENEMADHMAKRYGVASPTSLSSDATNGGSLKAGHHDALAKFLDKNRRRYDNMDDAIHVSISSSAEMKQQLADKKMDEATDS